MKNLCSGEYPSGSVRARFSPERVLSNAMKAIRKPPLSAVFPNSGNALLVSPDPRAIGKEQKNALREAFERCVHRPSSEPLDWIETRTPHAWRFSVRPYNYDWTLEEGESPFPIGIQRGPD
jgi:hypothetical protein